MTDVKNTRAISRYLFLQVIIAASYFVTGRLGLMLAVPPGYATAVWPPSGVALAALLLAGCRYWPGVFLGSWILNLTVSLDTTVHSTPLFSLSIATAIATGATMQALIGSWLVRRFIRMPNPLEQLRDIILLIALGGLLSSVINPTLSVTILAFTHVIIWESYYINWLTWWVGDVIGIIVFTPALMLLFAPHSSVSNGRKLLVTLTLCSTFSIAVYAFFSASNAEKHDQETTFRREAELLHTEFSDDLHSYLEILASIQSFYAASEYVSAEEFYRFVKPLFIKYPGIQSLSWNQKVLHNVRQGFEAEMTQNTGANFTIKDRSDTGKWVTAATRDHYFPITYIEPASGNSTALGYDTYVETHRKDALDAARDSGQPVATGRVSIVQDSKIPFAVILYQPIYQRNATVDTVETRRTHLQGYVGIPFLFSRMLNNIATHAKQKNLGFALYDTNASNDERLLYDTKIASNKIDLSIRNVKPDMLKWEKEVNIAGRDWLLEIVPTSAYFAGNRNWSVWFVLTGGLIFTGLFSILMLLITGYTNSIQRVVEKKTHQLRDSEETFRSTMEYAPIGMALVAPEGRFLQVNSALCNLLGYAESELLKTKFQELTHPDDLQADLSYVRQMLAQQITSYHMEKRYFHRNGHIIWILLNVSIIWNADNTPKYFVSQIQDITELKAIEKQRTQLINRLTLVNEQLEQFAYVASHDLREPIRTIGSFVNLLEEENSEILGEESRQYITIIRHATDKMDSMVADLLEYARLDQESERLTKIDCNIALQNAQDMLHEAIQSTHAVIKKDELPCIIGNPTRFFRLLQNLISNALKYQSPDNIPIIRIGVKDRVAFWEFFVKDNGIGIKAEFLEQVFLPFKRLHNQKEHTGTGIGLAICKRIVESLGGSLWVESTFGKGSIFYFTIPKYQED
jgi:PAS domain S-box-containing protein